MRPELIILAMVMFFLALPGVFRETWPTRAIISQTVSRAIRSLPPLFSGGEMNAVVPISTSSTFIADFYPQKTIEETGSLSESSDPSWWLNSGGRLTMGLGMVRSIQGDLPSSDRWFQEYAAANPVDTDQGKHPQNLLRLITQRNWKNFREQAYFRVNKYNMSQSPNRSESNGLLLFSRYQGSNNLYYMGLRVDGAAVIKKKAKGVYTTLAYQSFFQGQAYDRATNPDLIPSNQWIGLRGETVTNADGTVTLRLYTDIGATGTWKLALQATDDGITSGPAITNSGHAGIRTDFMDVQISDYRASVLK